jgi:hypothetical protein
MQTETRVTIHGYLVGNIWMPNAECYKDLTYDVTREQERAPGCSTSPASLP